MSFSKRASSPFFPFVEPLATKTNRPPSAKVFLGIGLAISPASCAGSPADPALSCQQVLTAPSHGSSETGLGDHPSQPSSFALPSVLTLISLTGAPHRYACA